MITKLELLKANYLDAEDDFEALKVWNDIMREERFMYFTNEVLPKLENALNDDVQFNEDKQCYTFSWKLNCNLKGKMKGLKVTVDVFPKANRLLIRQCNKWVTGATRWLEENIINFK